MSLPHQARRRIVAISLLGEVHDMIAGPDRDVALHRTTDYSLVARTGFRRWLEERYRSITALNDDLAAGYRGFDAVEPPDSPVPGTPGYVDLTSKGSVAIYGWVHDATGRDPAVDIFVDGTPAGRALYGLSRTDGTDAIETIRDPDVGFRLDLDFRDLAPGTHRIEVTVTAEGRSALLLACSRIRSRPTSTDRGLRT